MSKSTMCNPPDQGGGKPKPQEQSGEVAIGESAERTCEVIELRTVLLGAVLMDYAKVNCRFREMLREAIVATVTDPEDMALFPEFFGPHAGAANDLT